MGATDILTNALDASAREAILFAAAGFLIGGIDDLAIDLLFLWITLRDRVRGLWRRHATLADLPAGMARPIAIFVAAWDESSVIGAMLRAALARLEYPNYRLFVGTYPNDRATIDAVAAVAFTDPRIHLVIGQEDGPTTKAGCLNAVWAAMLRHEAAGGAKAAAVVLHDAEDMVDPGELRVFDALLDDHALVQLPVIPLPSRGSPLVAGHYLDEFAECHAKTLVVRQALGASLPLAGTGCAIRRDVLDTLAAARGEMPFDPASLVEDYELGLSVGAMGGRGILARVRTRRRGPLVAVRAHFPDTIGAAVRQKARWMAGIALAGWDRVGWSKGLGWRDHWMRMRDRRAPIAVLVLTAAYGALVLGAISAVIHWARGTAMPEFSPATAWLLRVNAVLLGWRLLWRAGFTGHAYGLSEAISSLPRALVSNLISLLAARLAMVRYIGILRGRAAAWDKTRHVFPHEIGPDAA